VIGVDISVNPASLSSYTCGTNVTVTYTATFHFPAHNAGAQVLFQYTTNNGRGSSPAGLTVPAGTTTIAYTFTWSGALPADHTAPGPGGVIVTSPNSLNSQLVAPSGTCSMASTAPFKVTSVNMAVNPSSLSGYACGTTLTVTYTATFHLLANGPGGTIAFNYTTNNGRGEGSASIHVAPGQTTATYTFTWHNALPADHTEPEGGGVVVSTPNAVTSPLLGPSGACS
jgi:hypothetical protein